MRIVVAGAGGMGGYYAALLARSGEHVAVIARGEHLHAIQTRGLRIEGSERFSVSLPAFATPAEAGAADLVLVCVKSYDLEAAAHSLSPLLHENTAVLALQNGVEHGERLATIIGAEHVLAGASYIVARRTEPGVIQHTGGTRIDFGALAMPAERVLQIQNTLRCAGIEASAYDDIDQALWRKFLTIVAYGSINCLTRAPASAWRDLPEAHTLVRHIAEEVQAVAKARGVRMNAESVEAAVRHLPDLAPNYSTSMLADLQSGSRLELETLQGAVVRLGRELGIPTPHTFTVYAALRPFRDGPPPTTT